MTKILIISGFLGAGKTTFIKALSDSSDKAFVVLENEYGGLNVDGDILSGDDIKVWEITERCMCCTGKADLTSNVLTIVNALEPEYLIVEPTGVGYLSNVINNVSKIEYERISLLSPITIVDPNSFFNYLEAYGDLFLDQIKCAGQIIISKCDMETASDVDEVAARIAEINPDAEITKTPYQKQGPEFWQRILSRKNDGTYIPDERVEESSFDSLTIKDAGIDEVGDLIFLMEAIIRGRYGNIVRGKGIIKIKEDLLRLDLADKMYSIVEAEDDINQKGLVFIGENIDKDSLNRILLPGYVNDLLGAEPVRKKFGDKTGRRKKNDN